MLYKGQCTQKKTSEDAATKVTCLQLLLHLNWHGIEVYHYFTGMLVHKSSQLCWTHADALRSESSQAKTAEIRTIVHHINANTKREVTAHKTSALGAVHCHNHGGIQMIRS